jgi:hypothetical protein
LSYLVGELFGYLAAAKIARHYRCEFSLSVPPWCDEAVARRSNTKEKRKNREPAGLTVSPERATIMKVAARREAESKTGERCTCSRRRCRWPFSGPVPEIISGSLRWAKGRDL